MEHIKNLLSFGNSKLPANTAIFNMQAAQDCTSRKLGLCKVSNICYADKAERMYPQVLPYRRRQEAYWKECSAEQFAKEFQAVVSRKRNPVKYLRVSESGDFRSQKDLDKLSRIADLLKGVVKVYAYTARKDLDFSNVSGNLVINGSSFMVHNNFEAVPGDVYESKDIKCPGDCKICSRCTVARGANIYVKNH